MTDCAARVRIPSDKPQPIQPVAVEIDEETTLAAIRQVLEENRDLLPADVISGSRYSQPAPPARGSAEAHGLPALHADETEHDSPGRRGFLRLLSRR
jgi:hypothetical protein